MTPGPVRHELKPDSEGYRFRGSWGFRVWGIPGFRCLILRTIDTQQMWLAIYLWCQVP